MHKGYAPCSTSMATTPLLSEYLLIDCKRLIGSRRKVVITPTVVVLLFLVVFFCSIWAGIFFLCNESVRVLRNINHLVNLTFLRFGYVTSKHWVCVNSSVGNFRVQANKGLNLIWNSVESRSLLWLAYVQLLQPTTSYVRRASRIVTPDVRIYARRTARSYGRWSVSSVGIAWSCLTRTNILVFFFFFFFCTLQLYSTSQLSANGHSRKRAALISDAFSNPR